MNRVLLFFFLISIKAGFSQVEPPVQYEEPQQNWRYQEPIEYSDHWAFNSSHVYSPLTIGYGLFNYHERKGDISNRNISFISFEAQFPVVINRKYKRDEILRYNQFLPFGTFLDDKEVDYRGYQFSALAMFDALGWRMVTLGVNYGFSFGQRKMVSFVNGDKYKIKNPFVGIVGGIDFRINVGKSGGLSLGGFANYMLDFSKDRWINKEKYAYTLPQRTKFTGWEIGAAIGFILFDEEL